MALELRAGSLSSKGNKENGHGRQEKGCAPICAPKAEETPAAAPAEIKSRLSRSLRNIFVFRSKPSRVERPYRAGVPRESMAAGQKQQGQAHVECYGQGRHTIKKQRKAAQG